MAVEAALVRVALEGPDWNLVCGDVLDSTRVRGTGGGKGVGQRHGGKTLPFRRPKELGDHMAVLGTQHRARRVDELPACTNAARGLTQQLKLKLGQVAIALLRRESPGDLPMAAHGARTRARRIHKHGVEQRGFTLLLVIRGKTRV